MERRLAAILAADVVGYSRLMAPGETGPISRQKAYRSELIDPTFAKYSGRIVKATGDGLLVEFPSVVDGVKCAVQVQRVRAAREGSSAGVNLSIAFRVSLMLEFGFEVGFLEEKSSKTRLSALTKRSTA